MLSEHRAAPRDRDREPVERTRAPASAAPAVLDPTRRAARAQAEALRAVQMLASPTARSSDPGEVHQAADRGLEGPGGPLPHLETIQPSFGQHDVSSVQAHVGGPAAAAAERMGATAYARGNQVGFGAAPDLHTAAHEAAHVVQQRSGVHLQAGVGSRGDQYERHADEVADLVLQGRSSEAALDRFAARGPQAEGPRLVQMKPAGPGQPTFEQRLSSLRAKLSRSLADWAVTDQDVEAALADLAAVPETGRAQLFQELAKSGHLKTLVAELPAKLRARFQSLVPLASAARALPVHLEAWEGHNGARAARTVRELRGKQEADKHVPPRLTERLVRILVLAVHRPRNPGKGDGGEEGILGIDHAVRAADALCVMPDASYDETLALLGATGGTQDPTSDRLLESALILKAVAARLEQYRSWWSRASAQSAVAGFAGAIRGQARDPLLESTTGRSTGGAGKKGLEQHWDNSCGPTSLQVMKAEHDPIAARALRQSPGAAKQDQKQQLATLGTGVTERGDYAKMEAFLERLDQTKDKQEAASLARYIRGQISGGMGSVGALVLRKALAYAETLQDAQGRPITRAQVEKFREDHRRNAEGTDTKDLVALGRRTLAGTGLAGAQGTQREVDRSKIVTTLTPADKQRIWDALFRGQDVTISIAYETGGHWTTLTDCRVRGGVQEVLRSEVTGGKSSWIALEALWRGEKGQVNGYYLR